MSLRKRYCLLALMLACFQALYFVPILFAPEGVAMSQQSGFASLLLGGSPFALHYQSVGLFPIVLGGLSITLLPIIDKKIKSEDVNRYKDQLIYGFGFFISIGVIHRAGISWADWRAYVVLLELMGSLQLIMMIIKFTEKLEVASSPVMIFFAWNILLGALTTGFSTFSVAENELWIYALFSIALMVFTVYVCHHFLTAQRNITVAYISPARGFQVMDRIRKKAALVSIMPVVVVSLGLGSLSMYFTTPISGLVILHHPVYACVFAFALWMMARLFTFSKLDIDGLFSHIETLGGKVVFENTIQLDTQRALKKWAYKRVWEQWFVLMILILVSDLVNLWFTGVGMPPVSYVAGLGIWLLVNALIDMRTQCDKLKYIYFL